MAPSHDLDLAATPPLVSPATEWTLNECARVRQIGPRPFYAAAQGPYLWLQDKYLDRLRQVGLLDRVIPGHINYSYIKYFLSEERGKLAPNAPMRRMVESFLDKGWPIHTIFYHRFQGNPPPTDALLEVFGDQWIGDGQPETVYRLEPVFHYLKTGERWVGSSMHLWDPEIAVRFFGDELIPRLGQELPFVRDLEHEWTRPELRRLSDVYCEEFYRPIGRCMPWGMYVGAYHMAGLPETIAVGEKGADAFSFARLRGMSRQFGGDKFLFVWRGHEPTEAYMYPERAWFSTRGDEWGLPLPHIWYYLYRPYLEGASYYVNEGLPGSAIQDIEGDGWFELSTLGHIYTDMLDFADRHPDRGEKLTPIGLMLDYTRSFPSHGVTYFGHNLPNDDADYFNEGLLEAIFPEHRHAPDAGGYSRTAPLGEIWDILQPNAPDRPADSTCFENYKALIALGGMRFTGAFARTVTQHVRKGGVLVVNGPDIRDQLPVEMTGVVVSETTVPGADTVCELDGRQFDEEPYALHEVTLANAMPLIRDVNGRPVATINHFGEGHVVVLLPHYSVAAEVREGKDLRGRRFTRKDLLKFVPHLLEHLATAVAPVEFRCREEDRADLSWSVARKGGGWVVTVYNYSCARETIVPKTLGTAKVHATYPLREVPFQLICRTPVGDVIEWYRDRDVHWRIEEGQAIISETIHGGEIRVYELQPGEVTLPPCTRFVNYALNQPVTCSSALKGCDAEKAVNGNRGRWDYWWSDTDPKRHYVFDMPQWLRVDLGEPKAIDHVSVLFHWWDHESLQTRLRVYKYVIEASVDGEDWQTVIDESRNEDPVSREGTERWFEPVEARYVRLTVLRNSAMSGARVVELEVMGEETEEYQPERVSIVPDWEAWFPPEVRGAKPADTVYLVDLEPTAIKPGWMPAGKKWAALNGDVKLITSYAWEGRVYPKSLYAQATSSFTYSLGGEYRLFAAAAGVGNASADTSVQFVVNVDGKEAYRSPVYHAGEPVLPVAVDVKGATDLNLVVTDGGDGIRNDYAWWGEARLIRK